MNPIAIIKLLKIAKDVKDYVKKPNNLDQQNDMILTRLDKLEKPNEKQLKMEKDIKLLKNALKTKGSNKKTDDVKWYDD